VSRTQTAERPGRCPGGCPSALPRPRGGRDVVETPWATRTGTGRAGQKPPSVIRPLSKNPRRMLYQRLGWQRGARAEQGRILRVLEAGRRRGLPDPGCPQGVLPASDLVCDVRPWRATGLAAKTPGSGHAGSLGSVGGGALFAASAQYGGAPFTEEVMS
jgi:hypothetical protein